MILLRNHLTMNAPDNECTWQVLDQRTKWNKLNHVMWKWILMTRVGSAHKAKQIESWYVQVNARDKTWINTHIETNLIMLWKWMHMTKLDQHTKRNKLNHAMWKCMHMTGVGSAHNWINTLMIQSVSSKHRLKQLLQIVSTTCDHELTAWRHTICKQLD